MALEIAAVENGFEYRGSAFGNHTLRNKTSELNQIEHHYESQARLVVATIDVERERSNHIIFDLKRKIEFLRGELKTVGAQRDDYQNRATGFEQLIDQQKATINGYSQKVVELSEVVRDCQAEIGKLKHRLQRLSKRRRR